MGNKQQTSCFYTSGPFVAWVIPLLLASGVGASSQKAIGTVVFGGMIAATLVSVLVVPVFYVLIQGAVEWYHKPSSRR